MTKRKLHPAKRGPKPELPGNYTTSIRLGEHEHILIRIYISRQQEQEAERLDTAKVLRRGLHLLCADVTPEEIEAERRQIQSEKSNSQEL